MMFTLLLMSACSSGRPPEDGAPYVGVRAALDRDHDGRLTAEEYAAGAPPVAPTFAEVDTDGDGELSAPEIATYVRRTDPAAFDPALAAAPDKPGARGRGRGRKGEHDVEAPTEAATPSGFAGTGPPLAGGVSPKTPGGPGGGGPGGGPGGGDGKAGGPPPGAPPVRSKQPPKGTAPGAGPTVDGRTHSPERDRQRTLTDALLFERAEILARAPGAALPTEAELRTAGREGPDAPGTLAAVATLRAAAEANGLAWPPGL